MFSVHKAWVWNSATGCVPGTYKVPNEGLSVARKQACAVASNQYLSSSAFLSWIKNNAPHPEGRTFYGTRTGPYMSLEAGHASSLGILTVLTVLMVQQKQL